MTRGRKKGWSERGEKGGRPKGSFKTEDKGRKTLFVNITVSCYPEEKAKILKLAESAGKSVSRFLVDTVL